MANNNSHELVSISLPDVTLLSNTLLSGVKAILYLDSRQTDQSHQSWTAGYFISNFPTSRLLLLSWM